MITLNFDINQIPMVLQMTLFVYGKVFLTTETLKIVSCTLDKFYSSLVK